MKLTKDCVSTIPKLKKRKEAETKLEKNVRVLSKLPIDARGSRGMRKENGTEMKGKILKTKVVKITKEKGDGGGDKISF